MGWKRTSFASICETRGNERLKVVQGLLRFVPLGSGPTMPKNEDLAVRFAGGLLS